MLVIVGEGKVRNSSVAVQDARGAQRHCEEGSESQPRFSWMRGKVKKTYSVAILNGYGWAYGPIERLEG